MQPTFTRHRLTLQEETGQEETGQRMPHLPKVRADGETCFTFGATLPCDPELGHLPERGLTQRLFTPFALGAPD